MGSSSTLGSLLLLFLAGVIAVLWIRGYFSRWLGELTAAVQTAPPLDPFFTGAGGSGRPLAK